MKKLIHLFIILALLSSCERKSGSGNFEHNQKEKDEAVKVTKEVQSIHEKESLYDYKIKVISITDGDTFKGLTKKEKIEIKYRIYGIDAPEKKQDFGVKSKEYLSELIAGKMVGIKTDSRDRYGRYIVRVYTPEGKDVSSEMLKAGMAWHYKEYDNSKLYETLEIEARKKHNGLWSHNRPIAPWIFRKK